MKRKGSILIAASTVLSLVFCVTAAILWIRSYWTFDSVAYPPRVAVFTGNAMLAGRWSAKLPTIHEMAIVNGRIRFLTAHVTGGGLPWRERMTQSRVVLHSYDQGADPFESNGMLGPLPEVHEWMGFGTRRGVSRGEFGDVCPIQAHEIPMWSICALTAVLPVVQLPRLARTLQRKRRRKRGHCPDCGYDLRATQERCPECGHAMTGTTTR